MISIIVPMYNCEKTICELLKSISQQEYRDYEVILIDDGSTDHTQEIVKNYCASHDNFQYYRQVNQGAPAARNHGLNLAKGEYIYFCDSDDLLIPETLKKLHSCIVQNNADLVVANYINIDENGKTIGENPTDKLARNILKVHYCFTLDPVPGTKLFSAKVIKNNGIRFDAVKIGQDLNFYLKYLIVSQKQIVINENVYLYRRMSGSISKTYKVENIMDIMKSFMYVQDFAKEVNADKETQRILEYVRLSHFTFQLRKRKHFSKEEYQKLRRNFCDSISICNFFDLKYFLVFYRAIIEYFLVKYINVNIRYI